MNPLFESNASIVKTSHPALYSKILNCADDGTLTVYDTRSGDKVPEMNLSGRKIYIHSRYEPVKEAERLIDEADTGKFNLFIVFGFGFGYHVGELLRRADPASTVMVLEKDVCMIRKAMESRDLGGVLRDERLFLLADPGEDDIAEALRGKSTYKISMITHRGSFQVDPDYYHNMRRIAKSYLSSKEVNIATLAKFEKTWAANIARNIATIIESPGANAFYDTFTGIPAIVAAAGPSLTQSIEFIRSNAAKAVIVAVDTSYFILRRHGITPHFCVCVDPQVINARYFEGDTSGRTVLVADPTVHPSVFRLFKGRKCVTGTAFRMMKWIEEEAGDKGELAYGGSVSTNAYDFARRLGASPVLLVGQDLAFTGGLAHARGSYLDEQVFLRARRLSNPLMFNRFQLTALPAISVKGIRSPQVRTNQKMMIFLSWFGKRNDPSLVNCTWDGAYINGVAHKRQEDILLDESREDIFSRIDDIYNEALPGGGMVENMRTALGSRCARMFDDLESLTPVLERAVKWSKELVDMIGKGVKDPGRVNYILKKLGETDRSIEARHTLKDMIGITIQQVIHTITEGYDIEEDDSSLTDEAQVARRSHYLYKGLLEGCLFNRKTIKKMKILLAGD